MPHSVSRRGFLQATGAGAFASLGASPLGPRTESLLPSQAVVAPGDTLGGWFDRPMRWVQLTLVENDPGRFDPQFWLDYFRRLHADAATLSAGGIVAYYPTDGPAAPSQRVARHSRSVRHARRRVPRARHARRRAHRSARRARRGAAGASRLDCGRPRAGTPRRHWANPDLWVTCALGPYNFEFMDQVHREIVAKYQVDGIFANRWAPQGGDCYCVHCVQNFKAATGADLPRTTDAATRAPAVPRVAQRAADRAVEAVGRDGPRRSTRGALHSQRSAGPEDRRRAGRHPVRRLPGAPRPDAAVGQRPRARRNSAR